MTGNDITKIMQAKFILADKAFSLIESVGESIDSGNKNLVDEQTQAYKKVIQSLSVLGVGKGEILSYNVLFKSLPWESIGYQDPKI